MNQIRRGKALLIVIVALLVVLLLAIVFLPPILNAAGISRNVVLDLVAPKVTSRPDAERVHLTWFGPQTIEGLAVSDEAGREAMKVNVVIHESLLPIVFGSYDDLEVDVSGKARGTVREDGSISLTDLFATSEEETEDGMLAGVPQLAVNIADLQLVLDLRKEGQTETLTLTDLEGRLLYVPGGELSVALGGPTEAGALRGTLAIKADATGLFDQDGALTTRDATVDASIDISSVPIPFEPRVKSIRMLRIVAESDDLADRIAMEARLETELAESDRPSRLEASLALAQPVAADGSFNFNPAALTGTVTGEAVPSALLQPLAADTPLVLARDIGPTVDLTASFSAGETRDIELNLQAENLSVDGTAVVAEDLSIQGRRLTLTATVQPALVAAMTAKATLAHPAQLDAELQSFFLPAPAEEGGTAWDAVALTGDITMSGPVELTVAEAAAEEGDDEGPLTDDTFTIADLRIDVESDALADGLRVAGAASVDEGRLEFAESITGLVDDTGALTPGSMTPVGQLSLSGVNASRLVRLLPEGAATIAARSLLGESLATTLRTTRDAETLRAEIAVDAQRLEVDATLLRRADGTLTLASGTADFTLTPDLVASLQEGEEDAVALTSPVEATLTLQEATFAGRTFTAYRLPSEPPLRGVLRAPSLELTHDALTEPAAVRDFVLNFALATAEQMKIDAEGGARVLRASEDAPVARLAYDLEARQVQDAWVPTGTITLQDLSVREIERLADLPGDPVTVWTGDAGTLRLTITGDGDIRRYVLNSDLPNLSGDVTVSLENEILTATAEDLGIVLSETALTTLLQQSEVEGGEGIEPDTDPEQRFTVAANMPLTVDISALALPTGLLQGEPFDPGAVRIDLAARGGPLSLQEQTGGLTSLQDLDVSVETSNLAEGVRFSLTGNAMRDGEAAGEISITGSLVDLVADGTMQVAEASLNLDADVTGVPTRLGDAVLGLEGLLVAAVGDRMDASFQSKAFSQNAGHVDLDITTSYGSLAGRLRGKDRSLRTTEDQPLRGRLELTPALRQRLLQSVHPLLADVKTTAQPIRFEFTSPTTMPLDGDLSRLKGDFRIEIGDVQFDSGSALLALLSLFEEAEGRETIPGSIEPVVANLRKGVLTYEQFAVKIGKYTLKYEGQIDLTTREVQLRTAVPLEALALTFKELEGYVEAITVPLVTVGQLGELDTKVDPRFNLAEAAAKAGFRGVLQRELEKEGIPIGNILGDLLGGGRDKEKEEKKDQEQKPPSKDKPDDTPGEKH